MMDGADRVPIPIGAAREEGGRVVLRRRKLGPIGTAVLRMAKVAPDVTVRLDEVASEAWRLMDGRRTGAHILAALQQRFPDEPDLAVRLGRMLSTLASRRLIRL